MRDTDIMTFGKYKGKMLGQIPADYMIWLYTEMKDKKSPFAVKLTEYLSENMEYYLQQTERKQ